MDVESDTTNSLTTHAWLQSALEPWRAMAHAVGASVRRLQDLVQVRRWRATLLLPLAHAPLAQCGGGSPAGANRHLPLASPPTLTHTGGRVPA